MPSSRQAHEYGRHSGRQPGVHITAGRDEPVILAILEAHADAAREKCHEYGRLPLHVALDCQQPETVILAILGAHPDAVREKDYEYVFATCLNQLLAPGGTDGFQTAEEVFGFLRLVFLRKHTSLQVLGVPSLHWRPELFGALRLSVRPASMEAPYEHPQAKGVKASLWSDEIAERDGSGHHFPIDLDEWREGATPRVILNNRRLWCLKQHQLAEQCMLLKEELKTCLKRELQLEFAIAATPHEVNAELGKPSSQVMPQSATSSVGGDCRRQRRVPGRELTSRTRADPRRRGLAVASMLCGRSRSDSN